MARREKISAVDTAWLRMDRPRQPDDDLRRAHRSASASTLRAPASEVVERALPALQALPPAPGARRPRVRSGRPTPTSISTTTSSHVALPGTRAASASCRRWSARLASTPLDPARPLWQFHLVDNYAGGSALVVRIHHCYADGIALVQVMLSMTDAARERPAGDAVRAAPAPARAGTRRRARRCWRSRSPA